MKKIIMASLVGGAFAFLLGWLLFGMLLFDINQKWAGPGMAAASLPAEQMRYPFLILSNVAFAFIMAWMFARHAGISTAAGGWKAGTTLGIAAAVWIDTSFYSMTSLYTLQGILLDVLSSGLMGAATGAVVGFVIGKVKD